MQRCAAFISIALLLLALSVAADSLEGDLLVDESLDENVTKIIWPGPYDTQFSVGGMSESGVLLGSESTGPGIDEHGELLVGASGAPTLVENADDNSMIADHLPIDFGAAGITITDNTKAAQIAEGSVMNPKHEPFYTSAPPRLPSTVPVDDLLMTTALDLVHQGEPSIVGAYGELAVTGAYGLAATGGELDTMNMSSAALEQDNGLGGGLQQSVAPASTADDATAEAGTGHEAMLLNTTANTSTPTIMTSVANKKSASNIASTSWTMVALFMAMLAAAL